LNKAQTNYGDKIYIIGNDDELGMWNLMEAKELTCTDGQWVTTQPIEITKE
jgi:hypothetical protein